MKFLSDILAKAGLVVDGVVTLNSVANANTNTDKFIVVDSGIVKYRTAAQILSDLGALSTATNSGTVNRLAKFTSASVLGDSQIFDNGTQVGVGLTNPLSKFHVDGSIRISKFEDQVFTYAGSTQLTYTTGLGFNSDVVTKDGTTATFVFANNVATQLKHTGVGSNYVANYAIGATAEVGGTTTNALIYGSGGYFVSRRRYSDDVSTNGSNGMYGVVARVIIDPPAPSTIRSGAIYALDAGMTLNSGNATVASGVDISSNFGITNTSTPGIVTDYFGIRIRATVGSATGGTAIVTNYYGLYIANPTLNATGSIAYRWALYSLDTAASYIEGNVLIGTTTNAGYKLDVNGTARTVGNTFLATTSGSGVTIGNTTAPGALLELNNPDSQQIEFRLRNSLGAGLSFNSFGSDSVTIDPTVSNGKFYFGRDAALSIFAVQSGNVGIGTATPSAKLNVVGSGAQTILNSGAASDARIEFQYNSIREGYLSWDVDNIRLGADTGNYLRFDAGGTERVRVTSTGTVGIGTFTPDSQLDVYVATATKKYLTVSTADGAGSVNGFGISFRIADRAHDIVQIRGNYSDSANGGQGGLVIATRGGSLIDRLSITSAGKVTVNDLAGTGTRLVTADANGVLGASGLASSIITGTGSENYIPKWTSTGSTLGDSQVVDNGRNVMIGLASLIPINNLGKTLYLGAFGNGLVSSAANNVYLTQNTYYNNNWKYASTGAIAQYRLISGEHIFLTASSGTVNADAIPGERMRITIAGNVGIGAISPQQKFVVSNADAEGLEFIPAPSANANQIQSYNRSSSAYSSLVLRASEYNIQVGTTSALYISTTTNLGVGTTTPLASAKLDVTSTTQGFLPPRMTSTQRAAISSPAVGLVVYQTDGNEGLWIYTNTNGWKALAIVV